MLADFVRILLPIPECLHGRHLRRLEGAACGRLSPRFCAPHCLGAARVIVSGDGAHTDDAVLKLAQLRFNPLELDALAPLGFRKGEQEDEDETGNGTADDRWHRRWGIEHANGGSAQRALAVVECSRVRCRGAECARCGVLERSFDEIEGER